MVIHLNFEANYFIKFLRSEIAHLEAENGALEDGSFRGTPVSRCPMSKERSRAIIHLAYDTNRDLAKLARQLVDEIDRLEKRNFELSREYGHVETEED